MLLEDEFLDGDLRIQRLRPGDRFSFYGKLMRDLIIKTGFIEGGPWCSYLKNYLGEEEFEFLDVQLLYTHAHSQGPGAHMDFLPKIREGNLRYRDDYLKRAVNIFVTLNGFTPNQGNTYVKVPSEKGTKRLAIRAHEQFMWYGLDAGYVHGAQNNKSEDGRYMLVFIYSKKRLDPHIRDQLITNLSVPAGYTF